MAVFGQDLPDDAAAHAAAALRAGQRIVGVAREFRRWVRTRFGLGDLPPFDVGVGIHTGPVMMFQLSVGGAGDLTAVGDTVNVASRLEAMSKELRWPIVASLRTIALAGAKSRCAERRRLVLPGRGGPIIVGRLEDAAAGASGPATALALSPGTRAVLEESARSTADAAKDAARRATLEGPVAGPAVGRYRMMKKIGEGEASSVFLAVDRRTRREVVLEVRKSRHAD
jgi:hypothetical protein